LTGAFRTLKPLSQHLKALLQGVVDGPRYGAPARLVIWRRLKQRQAKTIFHAALNSMPAMTNRVLHATER
jgi:hypothetical protein